ncbi:MAG: glycosyltransferase family 9 protein [Candidatus Kapabacteria bacterium]|nr:glycosyltransferase family 9 protein [Candidatus Kapabacteria bacterium]MDW8011632.1 glycosyltransferase family 9 protein [Bacteroidota bacterium]
MSRALPRLRDFSRIAVVQMAYLGDVALVLPLLQALRELHPTARRMLVVTPAAAPLAECAEAVDEVLVYDKRGADAGIAGLRRCAQRIRRWGAELLLVPHRSLRTALLTFLSSPRYSVGSHRSALPWVFDARVPYGWHLHEVERNLSLLAPFADVGPRWQELRDIPIALRFPEGTIERLWHRLRQVGIAPTSPVIVLSPGSAWATKRWSPHHYASLAWLLRQRDYAVVITGGEAEVGLCTSIAERSGALSLAGELSIPELLLLFRHARCVVGNDSAPIHLAELVGTPVVAIFGPTVPEFGFAPRLPRSRLIARQLPCRPCSVHGGHRCPIGTHACMESISPLEVLQQVLELAAE